ncbi:hypothetical protein H0H93_009560 [Arthromyces matolae]|nr:hypothetical protein H0H93_009560 [Arthromyces matolae]
MPVAETLVVAASATTIGSFIVGGASFGHTLSNRSTSKFEDLPLAQRMLNARTNITDAMKIITENTMYLQPEDLQTLSESCDEVLESLDVFQTRFDATNSYQRWYYSTTFKERIADLDRASREVWRAVVVKSTAAKSLVEISLGLNLALRAAKSEMGAIIQERESLREVELETDGETQVPSTMLKAAHLSDSQLDSGTSKTLSTSIAVENDISGEIFVDFETFGRGYLRTCAGVEFPNYFASAEQVDIAIACPGSSAIPMQRGFQGTPTSGSSLHKTCPASPVLSYIEMSHLTPRGPRDCVEEA